MGVDPAEQLARRPSLRGHVSWIRAVCELPTAKNRMLATAGEDLTVRLWRPYSCDVRRVLLGHVTRDWVTALATVVGSDGELLAS